MTADSTSDGWILKPPIEHNAATRLFCFPPAGSGAAIYRRWHDGLSPAISVFRVQPPGRETRFREELLREIVPYEDAVVAAIAQRLDRPFAFFGHSMGALIAYRVAQRLRQDYAKVPSHLFVSAFRSPQAPPMKRIHDLPDDEFIRELRDTYDGIPHELLGEREVLELMLPIVRADLAVIATHEYRPQPPIGCPISAFGGLDDHWIDEPQLSEWAVQSSGTFELSLFPGNHYYLNDEYERLFYRIRDVLG